MRVPKYWKYQASDETINGKEYCLTGWGYSDTSPEEAMERAAARLDRIRQRLRANTAWDAYDYHTDPIREERIQIFDNDANPYAIITRNGYGARVLNTAQVMFVDIDLPVVGFFEKLFGGKDAPRKKAMTQIETWLDQHRWAGFRIYETPAGYRLIATDKTYDPASEETAKQLEALGSDPLYQRLCRSQKCFRARLSAKPWRIGLERCPIRFPNENTKAIHAAWCDTYEKKAGAYAACRFIKAVGKNAFNSEIDRIVNIHDRESGALGATPLA